MNRNEKFRKISEMKEINGKKVTKKEFFLALKEARVCGQWDRRIVIIAKNGDYYFSYVFVKDFSEIEED